MKNIQFPWSVAEMVWQHHERLDGSGYPRGLKADKILLEVKILSVADVIEAIASHRPYRPALGIDAALEELSRGKGILYAEEVVDACIKIFQNDKIKLNSVCPSMTNPWFTHGIRSEPSDHSST